MNFTREALVRSCAGDEMLGVLYRPTAATEIKQVGVVLLVGGPQVRTGSHRQLSRLAAALASQGYPALTTEVRGMGDSDGQARSFEALDDDIAQWVQALTQACPSLGGVVLWGLCDAASAALMYVHRRGDDVVVGLALANPWVRSEEGLARVHLKHHYRSRLADLAAWRRVLAPARLVQSVRDLLRTLWLGWFPRPGAGRAGEHFISTMARAWQRRQPKLVILSGNDHTAREFEGLVASDPAWQGALSRPDVDLTRVPDADHTFSSAAWREAVEEQTLRWLARLAPGAGLPRPLGTMTVDPVTPESPRPATRDGV